MSEEVTLAAATVLATPDSSEHYWPFPTGPGQVVTDHDWETMASQWQRGGVRGFPENGGVPSAGNQGLYARRINATQVEIQPGVAHIAGHWYELKIPKVLDIDITGSTGWDASNLRRDIVTLRLDRANNTFRFVQLKGAAGTGGSLTLGVPGDELPLVQLDITRNVGLNSEPGDRRWFLGGHVRPLMGQFPWFDPAPYNGELGVDTVGSRLVVGKDGQWVSAREVFVNDTDSALTSKVQTLESQVASLSSQLTTTKTDLTTTRNNLAITQADLDTAEASLSQARTDLNSLQPGPWTNCTIVGSGLAFTESGNQVQVRRQGSIVHMRGRVGTSNGADMGSWLGKGSTAILTVPSGFRPTRQVYVAVTAYTSITSTSTPTALSASVETSGALKLYQPSGLRSTITSVELCFSWMLD